MDVICKLLVIGFISFGFAACNKCRCIDSDLSPNFILFDTSEVDTIIIRKYSKNGNFNNLIDTSFFDSKTSFGIKKNSDTVSFPYRVGNFSINADYDWKLYLPSINRTIAITDIISEKTSMPCSGKTQCINSIESLKIDGTVYHPVFYNFYITR